MNVLVDTPVWSLALRRRPESLSTAEVSTRNQLTELIREGRAIIIGPVRQEILSAVPQLPQFERLRNRLREFADQTLVTSDYELAAEFSNSCRSAGIAATAVDLLICAAAFRLQVTVFTTDRDFSRYQDVLNISLHR